MYVCYMDIDFVFFWYVNNLIFGVYDTKYTMYPYTFGWYHYRCILQVMLPSRHSWIRWSSWSFFLSLKIDQLFSAHFEGFGTHQTRGKSWNPVVFFFGFQEPWGRFHEFSSNICKNHHLYTLFHNHHPFPKVVETTIQRPGKAQSVLWFCALWLRSLQEFLLDVEKQFRRGKLRRK